MKRPSPDSGIFGISGTSPSLDDIPTEPQIPQSGTPPEPTVNPLEDGADLEKICSGTLADVIAIEKRLIGLSDDIDYIGMNIGIGLAEIQDLLPRECRIFYVGFSGPKGSGKSTATSFCARVCGKGEKLEGVTYPALAIACQKGRILCLDEFDAQSEKCPELATIVRQGIDLDAHYTKLVPDGAGGWREERIPIGGMKFLNWRYPLDDALLQRILVLKMVASGGVSSRMIVNNEAPGRFTGPIATWFAAQSATVRKKWTSEKILTLIEDKSGTITNKLDRLGGKVARHKQKAFWMLVVCELYGWDFDDVIRQLIDKQPEDESFDEYMDLAVEVYMQRKELADARGLKGPLVMDLCNFKKDMNQRIDDKGLPRLRTKGPQSWTAFRQECGFVDGVNERKDSRKRGKRVLTFDEQVLKAIGVGTAEQNRVDNSGEGGL